VAPSLLILSYVFPPDPEIGAWRPYRFRKYVEQLGHRVAVISSSRDGSSGRDANGIMRVPGEFPGITRKSLKKYVDLALRKLFFYDSGSVWIPPAVNAAAAAIAEMGKPVVLLSTSPPMHTHLSALWLKKRYGLPWIADFRDPMTGNLGRRLSKSSRHFDAYFERTFMRHADIIIANTDRVLEMWQERYPEFAPKIRLLWNGFDPVDFSEATPPPPARGFTLMAHVGTLYARRDPLYLLRAVKRQIGRGRLDPQRFRIAFYGPMAERVRQDRDTFQPLVEAGCVSFDPEQPNKHRSHELMRDADSLLLLDYLEETRLQVPAKLFFYVRTGRPVLACTLSDSSSERILKRCGVPSVCLRPDDSEDRLDAGVLEAAAWRGKTYEPSEWFLEHFDSARQAQTLSRWMMELADRAPINPVIEQRSLC
jgi:glycosyltransferase involved in cell wall biosynthesis